MISLIKPQFEAGRAHLRKGVVIDEAVRRDTVEKIRRFGVDVLAWTCLGIHPSPLKGPQRQRGVSRPLAFALDLRLHPRGVASL